MSKTKEEVLKQKLAPIFDHLDEMDDYVGNLYQEIYAAMSEYAASQLEEKEKEIERLKGLIDAAWKESKYILSDLAKFKTENKL